MSHLHVLRLAQFNRKKGTSRQGGAVFGMADVQARCVYPVQNCLLPLWVRSLCPIGSFFFFFFFSLLLRVREGLDYTCLIAL